MNPPPAVVLVGHGSRDPAAAKEFDALVAAVSGRLRGDGRDGVRALGSGYLEFAEPHVDQAIDDLVRDAAADRVTVVPLVLFGAGHLKDDGPAIVGRARRRYPATDFHLARDLGIHPAVLAVAEDRCRAALAMVGGPGPDSAVVVVGRGSTDPDACADYVKFVRLLGDGRGLGAVEAAFVAMAEPSLDNALDRAERLEARRIAVVPLFLFTGVLVDRIGERTAAWAAEHPEVTVAAGEHLGPDPRLADLVVERLAEAEGGDVRMNCDVCAYRVRLPGYEEKLGTPLSLAPPDRSDTVRGWRARRAANQNASDARLRRERSRVGLGRRLGIRPMSAFGDAEATDAADAIEPPVIEVKDLWHQFPDGTESLRGVDLTVERGERLALLGPNGAGKTTLALQIVGALPVRSGAVIVAGASVEERNLAAVRRRVGLVFQDPDDQLLLPTVAEDVAYAPRNQGLDGIAVEARVSAALDVVGLTDLADRAPQQLSLGERRRVALAGVLAAHPEILVLDEPTANLDPAARRDLIEIVRGLDSGLTVVVITHDLPLAAELCPRSVVLAHGRVAVDGPTEALFANPGLLAAHRLELPYRFGGPG